METGNASKLSVTAKETGNASSEQVVVVGEPQRKALVVDDNPFVRSVNAKFLEHAGYLVETANDGSEAVNKFQEGKLFNLVVMDWDMPIKTGPEAAEEIRDLLRNGDNRDFKVTIIGSTEHSSDADLFHFRNSGADYAWPKPFKLAMLDSLDI